MLRAFVCLVAFMATMATATAQTTAAAVRADTAPPGGMTTAPESVVAPAPTTSPALTPVAPAADSDVAALRQEVADLKAELARLRGPQAAAPIKADTVRIEPAPPVPGTALRPLPPQPVQPAPSAGRSVAPMESRNVKVSNVSVTDLRQGGKPGITVRADVTLNNVPDVPFTFEASLVSPNGQVHTDARSRPYIESREIRTGDDFDTDDYAVWMDLSTLFSSRPPEDLYVQVRILDLMGRPVAASQLHTFHRPWK